MGGSAGATLAHVWPRTPEPGQRAGPGGTRQGPPPAGLAHLSSQEGRRGHRPLGWRGVQPRLKLSRVTVSGP